MFAIISINKNGKYYSLWKYMITINVQVFIIIGNARKMIKTESQNYQRICTLK